MHRAARDQGQAGPDLRLAADDPQPPVAERLKRRRQHRPGQVRAEAGPPAGAERDVAPGRAAVDEAVRVEAVRVGPQVRVAVGQLGRVEHEPSGRDRDPAERHRG